MKIDLERVRANGESREFSFNKPGNNDYLQDIGGKFLDNLKVNLLVEKTGEHYLAQGRVKTVLELQCSRCLDRFNYPVDISFKAYLVDNDYREEFYQDEDVLYYSSDEVEMQPFIEELVFSEIPLITLCNNQCKGLCSECGNNLNINECNCQHENTDSRWDKLKELKSRKEVT